MTDSLHVGQKVELNDERVAYIRFIGETSFAGGEWIGVELEEATGKNNGAVQGERYFECDDNYGMFLRRFGIAGVLDDATPKPRKTDKVQAQPDKTRRSFAPGNVTRAREGTDIATRRQNSNVDSPTPGPRRQSGIVPSRSPNKSPSKQLASARPPSTATSQTATTPITVRKRVPGIAPRPSISVHGLKSLAPSASDGGFSRGPRQPLARPAASLNRASASTTNSISTAPVSRLSLPPVNEATRIGSVSSTSQTSEASALESPIVEKTEDEATRSRSRSPVLEDNPEVRSDAAPPQTILPTRDARSTSIASSQGPRIGSVSLSQSLSRRNAVGREVEDLQTKLRVMEKRRMEDREKLMAMDKLQQERDRFEAIIQKLQTKSQAQHQESVSLKKTLKELEASLQEAEAVQAEHDSVLEMATLDREMAEETAEVLRTELENLKQKTEELELEIEVLRQENEELGQEMSPEERTSQGWLQMERSNERLREALVRLRDMTRQQEADLKDQIKALEHEIQELGGFKQQYEQVKARLLESEAAIEDLRQQLDVALGAEEMIEELAEKNLALNESFSELRGTVDELENLKELNDELEINHVENEKQMQEEIDYKDSIIAEQKRRLARQNKALEDCELTIARFREVVRNLQNDLADMKASQQMTETEAEELTSKSRAMMDLNLKLHASVAKTQVTAIDLELRRLKAHEAVRHLAIVQHYLPEGFDADRDSVLALLRFERVAFKARLLHRFVQERASEGNHAVSEEDIFVAFKVLDQLTWITAMCDRFVKYISICPVESFAKTGSALYELEPVERALNRYIDSLKRQDLKEPQMAEELQRSIALITHLADTHMHETIESYIDDVLMRALLMRSHLENTAAAFTLIQTLVVSKLPREAEQDIEQVGDFVRKCEAVVSRTRYAKVTVGKVLRSVEELDARSLSLNISTSDSFNRCLKASAHLADYARAVGSNIAGVLGEEGKENAASWNEIRSAITRITESDFSASGSELFSDFDVNLRSLFEQLKELDCITSNLDMTTEFERLPAPWQLRSKEITSSKSMSADAQKEIERLKVEVQERMTQARIRETTLEEAAVRIELLESRMGDTAKKSAQLAAVERALAETERKGKESRQAMEERMREVKSIETDRDRWKKIAEESAVAGPAAAKVQEGAESLFVAGNEKEEMKREIEGLQAAIRFLREDNRRVRFGEDSRTIAWLNEPLIRKKSDDERRKANVEKEGREALGELLGLVSSASLVSLQDLPEDKLAWRPAKTRPRAKWIKQVEGFESWVGWVEDVGRRGRGLGSGKNGKRGKGATNRLVDRDFVTVGQKEMGLAKDVVIFESESY